MKTMELSRDEAREKLILKLWQCVDYWDKEPSTKRTALIGLMHTFLASGLDGSGMDIPPMEIIPMVSKEDIEYYKENKERHFPNIDIGGGLHEIMFPIGRKHGYDVGI